MTKQRYTSDSLCAFEADIANEFNSGHIRAPVHLDGGNELELCEIFLSIKPEDWCFVTWRSHYICLLKGVLLFNTYTFAKSQWEPAATK